MALGLNQTDFGKPLGITQGAITSYEIGRRQPMDAVILGICREYGVSEEWLKTGEGEMFAHQEEQARIAAFFGEALNVPENIKYRLVSTLSQLSPEDWDLLTKIAERLYKEHGGKDKGE